MKQLDQEGMKVIFAEITDFKGIKHSLIRFDGKSAFLIGGNGKGKSSVIDALLSPIDSNFIPDQPIHKGENRGSIHIKIAGMLNGQHEEYTIDTVFTPSKRTGILSMMNKDGEPVKNPKTKLKDMFGKISFDIYEFMRSSRIEQIKTLKKLTGVEDDINELDAQRKESEIDRRMIEKSLSEMEAVSKNENRPFTNEDVDKYSEPVDESAIMEELNAARAHEQSASAIKNDIERKKSKLSDISSKANSALSEIERLKELIKILEQDISHMREEYRSVQSSISEDETLLANLSESQVGDVMSKLSLAKEHNRMHGIIEEYRKRQLLLHSKRSELDAVNKKISDIDQQKISLIEQSQLPVKGLTFTDEEIYLDGLPFSSGQLNTQRILDVAAEISIASNKKLKMVMIREGSLFDKGHLKSLLERLNDRGYQWIVEWVDQDGGDLQVRFEEEDPLNLKTK